MAIDRRGPFGRCGAAALAAAVLLHVCTSEHEQAAQHDSAVRGGPATDGSVDGATDGRELDAATRTDAATGVGSAGRHAGDPEPGLRDAATPPLEDGAAPEGPFDAAAAADATAAADAAEPPSDPLPYAEGVFAFMPGAHAGFGEANYPDNVLGPPHGNGTGAGSLHVLSLGTGGSIALDFGPRAVVDGPGPDFVVFENAFWPGGDRSQVFAEPGEVSVSDDGETWHAFACDPQGTGDGRFPGCAGVTPTLVYDAAALVPLDPEQSGGDAFDLAELGLSRARFVRVRDLSTSGTSNNAGFDLDAIGLIHFTQDED